MSVETKYLTVIECPVVFPDENQFDASSFDLLPRLGITRGLESRHVRIRDERIIMVCVWKSGFCARLFFDEAWKRKAAAIWPGAYQIRFDAIDHASAA